jgi:hypothetical protein
MSAVRDRLRDAPLPGEADAAARALPVLEAALAEREPVTRTRRMPLRLAAVVALVALGLLVVLTPAGAEMSDWIEERFTAEKTAAPAFAALPDGGSVLAISRSGAYAVQPDGGSQHLGPFSEAGWSPRGLHVVGVNGRRLVAVTPTGTPKWTLVRRRRVHHPAWSLGDGFVVAYLEGAALKAVAGNGDPATDRVLRRGADPVTPSWRPGAGHVLTYAAASGGIETVDADSGSRVWRARLPSGDARALAWSRDGRRLVAVSSRSVTVLNRGGRMLGTVALSGVARDLALHPEGRRAAVVVVAGGRTRVLEVPLGGAGGGAAPAGGREAPAGSREAAGDAARVLFQGDVDGLAWSRDGRHLLLSWRDTGEWLLMGPGGRMRALHDVTAELGTAGGFPRVAGWCCAR